MIRKLIIGCFVLLVGGTATAQKYPERSKIRLGNRLYEKGSYPEAETAYRRALETTPDSYEGAFNLSDALYKQKRYDEAAQISGQLAADSANAENAAAAYFNQGNALFQQRKLQEALEAYKNSLRLNPGDMEAKFNYAYTKKLLENQNDKNNQDKNRDNKDNKDNKDQNKDQNKNDKDNPNKDQDQNKEPNKDQNRDKDPNKPDQQDEQQPPKPEGMSRDEAERLLDAVQGNEDNTKKKVDAQKAKAVGSSGKNW